MMKRIEDMPTCTIVFTSSSRSILSTCSRLLEQAGAPRRRREPDCFESQDGTYEMVISFATQRFNEARRIACRLDALIDQAIQNGEDIGESALRSVGGYILGHPKSIERYFVLGA